MRSSKVKGRGGNLNSSVASPSKDGGGSGKRKGKGDEEDGKKRQRTSSRNTPERNDDDGSGDNSNKEGDEGKDSKDDEDSMMPKDEEEKRYVPPEPLPYSVACPKPGCRKKYRHHKGLKFHVSAAHRELLNSAGDIRDTSEIERMETEAKERIAKKKRLIGAAGQEAGEENAPVAVAAAPESSALSKNSTPAPVENGGDPKTIVPSLTKPGNFTKLPGPPPDAKPIPVSAIDSSALLSSPSRPPANLLKGAPAPAAASVTATTVANLLGAIPPITTSSHGGVGVGRGLQPLGAAKPVIRPPINARPIVPAATPLLGPSAINNLKPIQPRPTIMAETTPHLEALEELRRSKKEQKTRKKENSASPGTSPPRHSVQNGSKPGKEERKASPPAKSPDAYSDISDDNDDAVQKQKQLALSSVAPLPPKLPPSSSASAPAPQPQLPQQPGIPSSVMPQFPFYSNVLPSSPSPQLPTVPVSSAAIGVTTAKSIVQKQSEPKGPEKPPPPPPTAAGAAAASAPPGSADYQKMLQAYGFPPFPYPIPPGVEPGLHLQLLNSDPNYKAKYERDRSDKEKAFKDQLDRDRDRQAERDNKVKLELEAAAAAAAAMAAAKRRDSANSTTSSSSSLSVKPEFKEAAPKAEEGAKPTMETRGPPPSTSAFAGGAYGLHPSMLRPGPPSGLGFPPGLASPFGAAAVAGINPLLLEQMYANSPYLPPHLQAVMRHSAPSMADLLRHPFGAGPPPTSSAAPPSSAAPSTMPEDLSRMSANSASTSKALELLQQHATQFYNNQQHKIHELQERALKSPNSAAAAAAAAASGKASPKASGTGAPPPSIGSIMAAAAAAASRPPLSAKSTPPPPTFTTASISSPVTSAATAAALSALSKSSPPPSSLRHLPPPPPPPNASAASLLGMAGYSALLGGGGGGPSPSSIPSPGAPPAAHSPLMAFPSEYARSATNDPICVITSLSLSLPNNNNVIIFHR